MYGETHTLYVSQTKEEREAKDDKKYVGSGKEYVYNGQQNNPTQSSEHKIREHSLTRLSQVTRSEGFFRNSIIGARRISSKQYPVKTQAPEFRGILRHVLFRFFSP